MAAQVMKQGCLVHGLCARILISKLGATLAQIEAEFVLVASPSLGVGGSSNQLAECPHEV